MEELCSCEISVPTFLHSMKTKRTAHHLNVEQGIVASHVNVGMKIVSRAVNA
jgi:hypothetical protein